MFESPLMLRIELFQGFTVSRDGVALSLPHKLAELAAFLVCHGPRPQPRDNLAGGAVGGRSGAVGGYATGRIAQTSVFTCDPETNVWS